MNSSVLHPSFEQNDIDNFFHSLNFVFFKHNVFEWNINMDSYDVICFASLCKKSMQWPVNNESFCSLRFCFCCFSRSELNPFDP